jgi:hypothetical protein
MTEFCDDTCPLYPKDEYCVDCKHYFMQSESLPDLGYKKLTVKDESLFDLECWFCTAHSEQ